MKKWVAIFATFVVLLLGLPIFCGHPTSPLQGKLKAVTVKKIYFQPAKTNSPQLKLIFDENEKTVRIEDPKKSPPLRNHCRALGVLSS